MDIESQTSKVPLCSVSVKAIVPPPPAPLPPVTQYSSSSCHGRTDGLTSSRPELLQTPETRNRLALYNSTSTFQQMNNNPSSVLVIISISTRKSHFLFSDIDFNIFKRMNLFNKVSRNMLSFQLVRIFKMLTYFFLKIYQLYWLYNKEFDHNFN